jgi:hypothetical protein
MLKILEAASAVAVEAMVREDLTLALIGNESAGTSFKEPRGGGYAPIKIPAKAWKFKGGTAIHPKVTFVFSGPTSPGVIYGYVVKRGTTPMWFELFPEPFPVKVRGDALDITLTLSVLGA